VRNFYAILKFPPFIRHGCSQNNHIELDGIGLNEKRLNTHNFQLHCAKMPIIVIPKNVVLGSVLTPELGGYIDLAVWNSFCQNCSVSLIVCIDMAC
jgi:hypothetical protein